MTECDVIVLTETWLSSTICNGEFFDLNSFNVFRKDRDFLATSKKRGGGVLIAARKNLLANSISLESLSPNFNDMKQIDILAVRVKLGHQLIYILTLYIPPSTSSKDYALLFESLMSINILYKSNVIIVGDFNISEFHSCAANNSYPSEIYNYCNNFSNFLNLNQKNHILNVSHRLLDLVYTNIDCLISHSSEVITSEDNYHPALEINLALCKKKTSSFRNNCSHELNFRKANFHQLYGNLCSEDFSLLESMTNVNDAVQYLYDTLYNICNAWVPLKKVQHGIYPTWYDMDIILHLKQKHKAWVRYKRSQTVEAYEIFKSLRNQTKALLKNSHRAYVHSVEAEIKTNPKKFWAFINDKKRQSGIPSTMKFESEELRVPCDIVNAFAKLFEQSFANDSANITHVRRKQINFNTLDITHVTENEVCKAIQQLKPTMTAGPDSIPSFLVRDCATVLKKPLTAIFNLILKQSIFPKIWKESRIIPVFKSGNRDEVTNYRPITLINNFSKVFEIVLHSQMYSHVANYLAPQQHGFIKGRSTATNLFLKTQFLSECLDKCSQVDCIYMDFSKAFDRLNHRLLLSKMDEFGFSESMITLFASYFSNRYQYVYYNGHSSDKFAQVSGVPQGSVMGPLLFKIFINDVIQEVDIKCLLYADDLKMFHEIKSLDDCLSLQLNINRVYNWSINNHLPLNRDKCFIKTYSRKVFSILFDYVLNGFVLHRPEFIRDLGITFDSKLNFIEHIRQISESAYRCLGFVIRNSSYFLHVSTTRSLYFVYVRSRLEYCSVVWSPIYKVHVTALERTQRRALKYMAYKIDGVYPCRSISNDILNDRFQVQSLVERRKYAYVIFLYKIVNYKIKCQELVEMLNIRIPRKNLRQKTIFEQKFPRTNILKSAPFYQMLECYKDFEKKVDVFYCKLSDIKKS